MPEAISVIIGLVIGSLITIYVHREDRKDKYRFAMIKDKFQVNQAAYEHSITMNTILSRIIIGKEEDIINDFANIKQWFQCNLLYLEPTIRSDFRNTIKLVDTYGTKLNRMVHEREQKNIKSANELYNVIEAAHERIEGLSDRIESCMDKYYE
jgi:hypothetical protein